MNPHDSSDRLADLHTGTADDLDAVLDIEAGLREAVVAAQHTRTHLDLDLDIDIDIEAGLNAIVPARDAPALPTVTRTPDSTPTVSEGRGAVAAWLMSLDSASRLVARRHPTITALARTLEITQAAANARDLVRDLGVALDLVHVVGRFVFDGDVGLVRDLRYAYELARKLEGDFALARGLDHACDLVRDLARVLDVASTGARARARDLGLTLDRASGLVRVLGLTLDRVRARDLDLLIALAGSIARARVHARALDRALDRDLDHARDPGLAPALARDLDRACHDFTTADLRGVDLNLAVLIGVRWSMATRWPSEEWRVQVLLNSTELGDGVYEIQSGTTRVPTPSA